MLSLYILLPIFNIQYPPSGIGEIEFSAAFAYHPLWPLLPLVAILLLRTILPRAARACLHTLRVSEAAYLRAEAVLSTLLLAAFLAVWVFRLCTGWRG